MSQQNKSPQNKPQQRRLHCYADDAALIADRVPALCAIANTAIAVNGDFRLVLSGGRTPLALFEALASVRAHWAHWHIYFADERCLPLGDPERNDTQASRLWLDHVAIPAAQIHTIPAELGAVVGAAAYAQTLENAGKFDLVLLGLGEDGHTASLFPGLLILAELHGSTELPELNDNANHNPPAIAVHAAPKPPPERISLSAERLSNTHRAWFLVTGAGKADALRRWLDGEELPAASIAPETGVDIYTDIDIYTNIDD